MKKTAFLLLLCLVIGASTACFKKTDNESVPTNSTQSDFSSASDEFSSDSSSDSSSSDSSSSDGQDSIPTVYKITFLQEGEAAITRYVNEGETLIDIPFPKAIAGYDVSWSVTEFNDIRANVEVTAIKTPKTYVITYKIESNVVLSVRAQKVRYQEEYQLSTPTRIDYVFVGWKIEGTNQLFPTEGIYTLTQNLVLLPVWEWSEGEWTN